MTPLACFFFFLMIRRPPRSPLFPSPTFFRSYIGRSWDDLLMRITDVQLAFPPILLSLAIVAVLGAGVRNLIAVLALSKSEEHTSELQSQSNLVCRLLLEKKKTVTDMPPHSAH